MSAKNIALFLPVLAAVFSAVAAIFVEGTVSTASGGELPRAVYLVPLFLFSVIWFLLVRLFVKQPRTHKLLVVQGVVSLLAVAIMLYLLLPIGDARTIDAIGSVLGTFFVALFLFVASVILIIVAAVRYLTN